jgi:hypothetical protein
MKEQGQQVLIKAYFSNQSTAPMEKLMLRLAAPKVFCITVNSLS